LKIYRKVTTELDTCGVPTKLMLLKFTCNLFSNYRQEAEQSLMLSTAQSSHDNVRDLLTRLVVESLLAPEPQLRQAASLTVFNLSWVGSGIFDDVGDIHDDEWITELLAAVSCSIETQSAITEASQVNDETGNFNNSNLIDFCFSFPISVLCWTFTRKSQSIYC
jgi:hypothetical protein